jgi:hypothetical protein
MLISLVDLRAKYVRISSSGRSGEDYPQRLPTHASLYRSFEYAQTSLAAIFSSCVSCGLERFLGSPMHSRSRNLLTEKVVHTLLVSPLENQAFLTPR